MLRKIERKPRLRSLRYIRLSSKPERKHLEPLPVRQAASAPPAFHAPPPREVYTGTRSTRVSGRKHHFASPKYTTRLRPADNPRKDSSGKKMSSTKKWNESRHAGCSARAPRLLLPYSA